MADSESSASCASFVTSQRSPSSRPSAVAGRSASTVRPSHCFAAIAEASSKNVLWWATDTAMWIWCSRSRMATGTTPKQSPRCSIDESPDCDFQESPFTTPDIRGRLSPGFQAGVHPKVVSDRLGHSSVAFTLDIYSHAIQDLDDDAAVRVADLIHKGTHVQPRP